jgi:hypothetical protein
MPAQAGTQYSRSLVGYEGQGLLGRPVKPGDDNDQKKGESERVDAECEGEGNAMSLLRYGADRLCLWALCRRAACLRAKACREDPEGCTRLMGAWLDALEAESAAAPTFAAMEEQIATPEELRLYRAWRKAMALAADRPKISPAETAPLREALRNKIRALSQPPQPPS